MPFTSESMRKFWAENPKLICLRGHSKEVGKPCIQCARVRGRTWKRNLSSEKGGWYALRDVAKQSGLIADISFQEYKEFREKPCFYCGEIFQRGRTSYSLDRIDNTRGYLKDNVVPCCYRCNHSKAKMTMTDFINFCHLISERFPRIP